MRQFGGTAVPVSASHSGIVTTHSGIVLRWTHGDYQGRSVEVRPVWACLDQAARGEAETVREVSDEDMGLRRGDREAGEKAGENDYQTRPESDRESERDRARSRAGKRTAALPKL